MKKKLIEVAIPLKAINEASAREKSIRHGHPSTLHLWWARRPLATARAILFTSLVDDPSSHPELFPTEEEQNAERERLFKLIEDLVQWENIDNKTLLDKAKAEIKKYNGEEQLEFLDPFSGGGAIPLEAQRLGLKVHAHDLNPVAVMINKAMIEIPQRFLNLQPVNPHSRKESIAGTYTGYHGLAEDVRYYGTMLKNTVKDELKRMYPEATLVDSSKTIDATVISWIWARSIECTNPACGSTIPLVKSFNLSTRTNREFSAKPKISDQGVTFTIENEKSDTPGTVGRRGATCLKCGTVIPFKHIRDEGIDGNIASKLMAIVAEGDKGRVYLNPDNIHYDASNVPKPAKYPDAIIDETVPYLQTPKYGMSNYSDMFTNRQLTMLSSFVRELEDLRFVIEEDAKSVEDTHDTLTLSEGGAGAVAYSEAILVYLSFVISKMVDYHSTICSWSSSRETIRGTFGRQAIPMVWDYAEANPFSNSSGCFDNMLNWVVKCIPLFPFEEQGVARQMNAAEDSGLRGAVISTDPPYYDNIGYADLSDYFYIWMRDILRPIYPELFSTMLVPKVDELVAMRHRFDGDANHAKKFFEDGMYQTFLQMYNCASANVPISIYYAFKQSETEGRGEETKRSSTGWETFLSAIIRAGFVITGTWPVRTELSNRMRGIDSNALASSIVLVCRKATKKETTTRRDFVTELRRELRESLEDLQASNIAPVDLAQSSIGPGISVYSKYSQILEPDGSNMSVRSALQIINQELDAYILEQDGNIDADSRFCVELYTQFAFNNVKYGEAEVLARAKNTSITRLANKGLIHSEKGIVHLHTREKLIDIEKTDSVWLLCQKLTHILEIGGIDTCAEFLVPFVGSMPSDAKALAYRLFTISERKKWTSEAYSYNNLVVAWPDIQTRLLKLVNPAGSRNIARLDRWV